MKIASILRCDIANGTGFRVSLFVSGCSRKCPGCFNQTAQDPEFGSEFNEGTKQKIFDELSKDYCKGLSLLGGDPMSKLSDIRPTVISFCKEVKEKFPTKDIWMWSGYTFEELLNDEQTKDVFKYIDVLVDGPFIQEQKHLDLKWKGSDNQRIIDINEWRKSNTIKIIN